MIAIPFAALAPGERERILKAHGQLPPSPKEKRVQAHLEQELSVIDAKGGGEGLTPMVGLEWWGCPAKIAEDRARGCTGME